MELRQYLDILKRHRWFILEATVVLALVAGVLSALQTPSYQGTARVLLRPNDPTEQFNPENTPRAVSSDPNRYVSAQKDIIASEAVAQEAVKSLRGLSPQTVQNMVSVAQSGASDVVEISGTDVDPVRARDLANAVAKGYIENRRLAAVEGLQRAAEDLDDRLAELQKRIGDLDTRIGDGSTAPLPGAQVRPVAPANPTPAPRQPTEPPAGTGLDDGAQPTTAESLKAARYAASLQYQTLYARQQELLVDVSLKRGAAELISLAKTPTAPVSPKPRRNGLLGGFLGLLLGVGVSFLREQLDDRVHSSHELERLTGLPVLAQLPYDEELAKAPDQLAVVERPQSPLAEAARSLRTSIQFLGVDKPIRIIVVTSPGPGDGKSLVAATLAAVYAQAGYRTNLISADLRRPRLSSMIPGARSTPGLTDVIAQFSDNGKTPGGNGSALTSPGTQAGRATATATAALSATSVPNLLLMPSGPTPPNPAELLGSRRMAEVLTDLSRSADVVIIDTPPLLAVTDAAVLAAKADGVVLVTALGETKREAAQRAKAILEGAGARILGIVMNKALSSSGSYYYSYYGQSAGTSKVRVKRRKAGPGVEVPRADSVVAEVQPDLTRDGARALTPGPEGADTTSSTTEGYGGQSRVAEVPLTAVGRRLLERRRSRTKTQTK